jgi:hypothetical protein
MLKIFGSKRSRVRFPAEASGVISRLPECGVLLVLSSTPHGAHLAHHHLVEKHLLKKSVERLKRMGKNA